MPFSVYSPLAAEDERRRQQEQSLAAAGASASQGINTALDTMHALANEKRNQAIEDQKNADAHANTQSLLTFREGEIANQKQAHDIAAKNEADRQADRVAAENDRQRTLQIGAMANAASTYAHNAGRNGKAPASIDEFSSQFLGQPGYEQLKPDDVQHLYDDAVEKEKQSRIATGLAALPAGASVDPDALTKIASDAGASLDEVKGAAQKKAIEDTGRALSQKKIEADIEHGKQEIGVQYAGQKNARDIEQMKLDAAKEAAANKPPNVNAVETMQSKKAFIESIDQAIAALSDPSKDIDLNKIAANRKARALGANAHTATGALLSFGGQKLTALNPDEAALESTLTTGMERGTGAISSAHRALAERGKATMDAAMTAGSLDKGTAIAALQQARKAASDDLAGLETALPKEGARVGVPESAAGASTVAPAGDRVRVRDVDGTVYDIKRENLDEALSAGAELVE